MKKTVTFAGISVLFCLVCLGLWRLPASAGDLPPELVKKVQSATVIIHVYDKTGKPVSQGSGFLYRSDGHVISNYHVLGDAAMAKVKAADGREYNLKAIVAEDKEDDLIEATSDIPASVGRYLTPAASAARIGEQVMVIGSPMGVEKAISEGKVLMIREIPKFGRSIVHNAHSFPGSSGSPLVNVQGEVVGIESGGVPGMPDINFAVPVDRFSGLRQTYRQLNGSSSTATAATEKPARPAETGEQAREAAISGDPEALVKLAMRHEQGDGVSKSCQEALRLYRKAADQKFVVAEYHAGRMYLEGKCIDKNPEEAAKWMQRAAKQGFAEAQKVFGAMCFNGEGVARDRVQACMWEILAASQKNAEAQKMLRLLSSELKPDEIKTAQEMAKNWKPGK